MHLTALCLRLRPPLIDGSPCRRRLAVASACGAFSSGGEPRREDGDQNREQQNVGHAAASLMCAVTCTLRCYVRRATWTWSSESSNPRKQSGRRASAAPISPGGDEQIGRWWRTESRCGVRTVSDSAIRTACFVAGSLRPRRVPLRYGIAQWGVGGSHDESCSSPRVHDAWLRLRHRHYREVATNREITYVEEKGTTCAQHAHRRNHTLAASTLRRARAVRKSVITVRGRHTSTRPTRRARYTERPMPPRGEAIRASETAHHSRNLARNAHASTSPTASTSSPRFPPAGVSVVVTSPPYNLASSYRSYHDTLPRDRLPGMDWRWIAAARRVLDADRLALPECRREADRSVDRAWTSRRPPAPHLELQNTIHWIKSIAIDREAAGAAVDLDRDLAVGHYKPINSTRFVNDCHEFIFHFTPRGTHAARSPRASASLTRMRRTSTRWQSGGKQPPLPREHVVHPLRDDSEPGEGPSASRHFSAASTGVLLQAARPLPRDARDGSVSRARQHRRRRRPTRPRVHRRRDWMSTTSTKPSRAPAVRSERSSAQLSANQLSAVRLQLTNRAISSQLSDFS